MDFTGISAMCFLLVFTPMAASSSANILFAMTGPNSHYECGVRVAHVLKSHGHNVTFLIPEFESKSPAVTRHAGVLQFEYTSEKRTDGLEVGIDIFDRLSKANLIGKFKIGFDILDLVKKWWREELEKLIGDPQLMDRISKEAYDLIIIEGREMATIQNEYNVATDWWGHDSFGRAEIWLTNSNFATDYPRPFFPNMGMVGGLTVEASKPLDHEFEAIMRAAGDSGVLIVSMGTVIKSRSQNLVNSMAEAFAKLPLTVIWKATEPLPEKVGNNTLLREWIPQNDLLGHPNTRAMVYHCGNNGAFEALYHGVPIIAVPVFADQTDVAYRVMSNGMGVVVEPTTLTNETMFRAVSEVISNPKYKSRAMLLSAIFKDYDNPVEKAAFWIEYVLRHNGARLLKSKAADMSFVREYLLDVFTVIFGVGLLCLVTTKHFCSKVCKTR